MSQLNAGERPPASVRSQRTLGGIALAIAAVVLAGTAAWWWSHDQPLLPTPEGPAATPLRIDGVVDDGVTVHVSGAVADPGLVKVSPGARVADAIAAAGGVLPSAEPSLLNLAAPVRDGERVMVPTEGASVIGGGEDDGKVHVNDADATEMQGLPGVGPVLAERIVSFRSEQGPFTTVEDLLDVPGIGEGKLAAMRDVIAVP